MIHSQVYGHYKECLPDRATNTKEYFPNGKNSIRVRQNKKFETIDQFLAGMKGVRKHG